MKKFTANAPYGVTVIRLANGAGAIYLHGEQLAWADSSAASDGIQATGERLAGVLGVPCRLLIRSVPDGTEWRWQDITTALGWGETLTLPDYAVGSLLECSTAHMTAEDNDILGSLSESWPDSEWILNTGFGFLLRLDAVSAPVLRLKAAGLSRALRKLVFSCHVTGHVRILYLSAVGDRLEFFETFDW